MQLGLFGMQIKLSFFTLCKLTWFKSCLFYVLHTDVLEAVLLSFNHLQLSAACAIFPSFAPSPHVVQRKLPSFTTCLLTWFGSCFLHVMHTKVSGAIPFSFNCLQLSHTRSTFLFFTQSPHDVQGKLPRFLCDGCPLHIIHTRVSGVVSFFSVSRVSHAWAAVQFSALQVFLMWFGSCSLHVMNTDSPMVAVLVLSGSNMSNTTYQLHEICSSAHRAEFVLF